MKYQVNQNCLLLFCTAITLLACEKKSDDTNGGGGGGGGSTAFTIAAFTPDYLYWGDVLTITGSGFSTNKNDYNIKFINDYPSCNLGAFEVISATSGEVKIKIPVGISASNGKKCGPTSDRIIVTINGKSDTTNGVRFFGWPRLQGVCTHFGGWAGDYVIPGDSVAMNMAGASGLYASVNNNNTNAVLTVDGINMPIAWRDYSACTNSLGGVITLDKEVFGKLKCSTDPDWGGGGRNLRFKISNPGTDRFDTVSFFVNWLPTQAFFNHTGSPSVSMSAGGFPSWTIKGKNMSYQKARFTTTFAGCPATAQEVGISHSGTFYDEGVFPIPLSVLSVGCSYTVSLISHCGAVKILGGVQITP
jgi:hypothetical protein